MCCLAIKLARKDVQLDTALSHRRTSGKAGVITLSSFKRNGFDLRKRVFTKFFRQVRPRNHEG
jgi:hypothetical protein